MSLILLKMSPFWSLASVLIYLIGASLQDCERRIINEVSRMNNNFNEFEPWKIMRQPPRYYSFYDSQDFYQGRFFTICTNIDSNDRFCPQFDSTSCLFITDIQNPKLIADVFGYCPHSRDYVYDLRIENASFEIIEFEVFVGFPSLRILSLAKNNLKEIKTDHSREALRYLTKLTLAHNKLESIHINDFEGLYSLEILNFEYNLISSIDFNNSAFHGADIMLKTLNLANNKLTVIKMDIFNNLPKLEYLDLTANKLNRIAPEAFALNQKLGTILLSENYLLEICNMILPNATKNLNVSHTAIHYVNFTTLQNVEVVDLSFNAFVFENYSVSSVNMSVEYLICENMQIGKITIQTASNFFYPLKKLQYLDLSWNELQTLDVTYLFGHMKSLTNLILAENQLQTLDFKNLTEKLEILNLQRNFLRSVDGMAHLSSLKKIDLSSNKLVEITLKMFAGLTNLRKLLVRDNSIASLQMGCFQDLNKLQVLDLSENDISVLDAGIFSGLYITTLRLSHNKLTILKEGILHGDQGLKLLDVSYNKINSSSFFDMLMHLKDAHMMEVDIRNNNWPCGDILKAMKTINIVFGNETNVGNIRGIECTNKDHQHKAENEIAVSNFDKIDKLVISESKALDRIGGDLSSKLATGNTLMVLILVLLAVMFLAKCVPNKFFQKTKLFRWNKQPQDLELLPESENGNNF